MADLDKEPLAHEPARHDGMASCRLCSSTDAAADHGWCAAAEGLVCEACCRRVLLGDVTYLRSPSQDEDLEGEAGLIIAACLGCERGRRWYSDRMLEHVTRGTEGC